MFHGYWSSPDVMPIIAILLTGMDRISCASARTAPVARNFYTCTGRHGQNLRETGS